MPGKRSGDGYGEDLRRASCGAEVEAGCGWAAPQLDAYQLELQVERGDVRYVVLSADALGGDAGVRVELELAAGACRPELACTADNEAEVCGHLGEGAHCGDDGACVENCVEDHHCPGLKRCYLGYCDLP